MLGLSAIGRGIAIVRETIGQRVVVVRETIGGGVVVVLGYRETKTTSAIPWADYLTKKASVRLPNDLTECHVGSVSEAEDDPRSSPPVGSPAASSLPDSWGPDPATVSKFEI